MGMYDDIFCECDLPDDLGPEERHFQTKFLYRMMDRFTITKTGRLINHFARYVQDTNSPNGLFRMIPVDQQDMQFHGRPTFGLRSALHPRTTGMDSANRRILRTGPGATQRPGIWKPKDAAVHVTSYRHLKRTLNPRFETPGAVLRDGRCAR